MFDGFLQEDPTSRAHNSATQPSRRSNLYQMQMKELKGLHLPDCETMLMNVDPNGLHNSRPSFFNSRRTHPGTKSFTNAQDKTREHKHLKISSLENKLHLRWLLPIKFLVLVKFNASTHSTNNTLKQTHKYFLNIKGKPENNGSRDYWNLNCKTAGFYFLDVENSRFRRIGTFIH